MAKIKVNELAKELGIKNNDLMSYLREKGVDAKSVTSMVDDDAIAIAESFFGKRKIKKQEPKPEAKSTRLFYKDGSVVHTKDAEGNPLPITGHSRCNALQYLLCRVRQQRMGGPLLRQGGRQGGCHWLGHLRPVRGWLCTLGSL